MKQIPPMPSKEPVINDQGKITPAWIKFFQAYLEAIQELQDAVVELQGGP